MGGQYKYSQEVMEHAIRVIMNRGTRSMAEVSAELGISKSILYLWAKKSLGTARRSIGDPALAGLEPSHNGYAAEWPRTPEASYEAETLREQRDRLQSEVETLRRTVVLLGKK